MHPILEYIPLILFFIIYKFFDIYIATASLIVTSALQILYFVVNKKSIPKRNLIFFALIAVFGGLTIFLHNDAFLKWKVTIINGVFAFALLISERLFNKNIIKQLLGAEINLPEKIWRKLNMSWVLFFLMCAVLNWYIAFHYSQDVWVNFKVFGLTALTIIFAVISIIFIYKYIPEEDKKKQ